MGFLALSQSAHRKSGGVIPVWLLGISLYFSGLRVFSENLLKDLDSEHTFDFVLTCDCEKWKIMKGGTRIWTGDLLICSQMLYPWAIPPGCSRFWTSTNSQCHNTQVCSRRQLPSILQEPVGTCRTASLSNALWSPTSPAPPTEVLTSWMISLQTMLAVLVFSSRWN